MKLYFRTGTKKMEIDTEGKTARVGWFALPLTGYITIKAEDFNSLVTVLEKVGGYTVIREA